MGSYLRRYCLCALAGITIDDDDDGNAAAAHAQNRAPAPTQPRPRPPDCNAPLAQKRTENDHGHHYGKKGPERTAIINSAIERILAQPLTISAFRSE